MSSERPHPEGWGLQLLKKSGYKGRYGILADVVKVDALVDILPRCNWTDFFRSH